MSAGTSAAPRFTKGQQVHFVGGTGAVKNYQFGPGYITYLVEMEMGPEPEVGRIGQETTICLFESDLKSIEDKLGSSRAIA
jgi:hypothetical protein